MIVELTASVGASVGCRCRFVSENTTEGDSERFKLVKIEDEVSIANEPSSLTYRLSAVSQWNSINLKLSHVQKSIGPKSNFYVSGNFTTCCSLEKK